MLTAREFKKRASQIIKQESQSNNDYEHIHRDELIGMLYDAYRSGYEQGINDYIRQDS
jgi:hypothetical protein